MKQWYFCPALSWVNSHPIGRYRKFWPGDQVTASQMQSGILLGYQLGHLPATSGGQGGGMAPLAPLYICLCNQLRISLLKKLSNIWFRIKEKDTNGLGKLVENRENHVNCKKNISIVPMENAVNMISQISPIFRVTGIMWGHSWYFIPEAMVLIL